MRFAVQQAVTHIRLPADFEHTEANMDTLCKALTLHCRTVAPTATVRSVASAASAVAVLMWPTDVPLAVLVGHTIDLPKVGRVTFDFGATTHDGLEMESVYEDDKGEDILCTPQPGSDSQ